MASVMAAHRKSGIQSYPTGDARNNKGFGAKLQQRTSFSHLGERISYLGTISWHLPRSDNGLPILASVHLPRPAYDHKTILAWGR